jgi:aminopeptidase N
VNLFLTAQDIAMLSLDMMIRWSISLLFAIAMIAVSACQRPQAQSTQSVQDVVSNILVLTPDFDAKTIAGRQTTRFRRAGSTIRTLKFSNNAMIVDNATINDIAVTPQREADSVVISVPASLQSAPHLTLRLTFHGVPKQGVTWGDNLVFSSYFGCDWMFCSQDEPGDKSNLALALNVPPGMNSVAAGERTGGATAHTWQTAQPYSPYLFGFAAGTFETTVKRHSGMELAYINATGKPADLEALFGTTPAMVDFFTSKAGMPLPTKRYSQILVDGDVAQEQATYSLIGANNISPILNDPKEDWVIAHELAHQWWGNSVTCASWRDFWLNEGITVFMTAAWKEQRHGRAAYDHEMELARTRLGRALEAGWDKPLAFTGTYPLLRWRRAVQYSKGALFMDHLRTLLGEQPFWDGLRHYTRANAGKTVVSKDFQTAMEKASGRDLSSTFNQWVYDTH